MGKMIFDRKEIAFKIDVKLIPSSSFYFPREEVLIKFTLEDKGKWNIDPRHVNVTRPMNDTDTYTHIILFDPEKSEFFEKALSSLSILRLDPCFHEPVLNKLEAKVGDVLSSSSNKEYIIEFFVTIRFYNVYRFRDEDKEMAIKKGHSGRSDTGRRAGVKNEAASNGWVLFVNQLPDVEALGRVMTLTSDEISLMDQRDYECAICYREMWSRSHIIDQSYVILRLPCKHVYHQGCILEWFKKQPKQPSCPLYRQDCRIVSYSDEVSSSLSD